MRRVAWQRLLLRGLGTSFLSGCCLLSSGCALGDLGKSIFDSSVRLFRPSSKDYVDDTDQKIDEWSEAGAIGRGDRPRDHESDGLTSYMSSPKAQGIERNLGVD